MDGVSRSITTKYTNMNADSLDPNGRIGFQRTAILIEHSEEQ